jgi:hypothetical protein
MPLVGSHLPAGVFHKLDSIAQEGINIQFVNAFEAGGQFGILIWVDDADIDRLAKLLSAA